MTSPTPPAQPPGVPRRSRRGRLLLAGAVVVAVVAVALAVGLDDLSDQGVEVDSSRGDQPHAPGFALVSLTDDSVIIDLADHAGTPVVLNFWASWCVPCRREMPALEVAHEEFAGQVVFVGVNHQDDRDAALDLVAEAGVTYSSVYDPQGQVARDYELFGMPTTVFITAEGRIAGRHTGALTLADLRAAIEPLLDPTNR